MPRKSRADEAAFGELHTEACPKFRRRWRRDVIPEVGAWLLMHARRYEAVVTALRGDRRRDQLPHVAGQIAQAHAAAEVVGNLIGSLWEQWPGPEWFACVTETQRALETIRAAQQLPPELLTPPSAEKAS